MQDEALSSAGHRRSRSRYWPIVLPLGLIGLYFAVTSGIRAYVSQQIHAVEGRAVPKFTLTDRGGQRWTEADLRGKVSVLNFFRSRCAGCVRERVAIHSLAAESATTGVQVLSVMMDVVEGYPSATTEATLQASGYTHPVLMADAAFVDAFHGVGWSHVTPVSYIVNAKGVVTKSLRGHQSLATLRAATR